MENSGEKINNNQDSEKRYEYSVVCMRCGKACGTKKTDDAEMAGKTSHGICRECARKECIENARNKLFEGFEE